MNLTMTSMERDIGDDKGRSTPGKHVRPEVEVANKTTSTLLLSSHSKRWVSSHKGAISYNLNEKVHPTKDGETREKLFHKTRNRTRGSLQRRKEGHKATD